MQSTSRETLAWKKHKLESRLPGEISITSDMQMTPPLWQKVVKVRQEMVREAGSSQRQDVVRDKQEVVRDRK